jgi:hypothetical protein
VNPFQRRLAFIALAAILLKISMPEITLAQLAMFGGLALAIWQLRTAVFRACLERLLSAFIFFIFDILCVVLFFVAYRIFLFQPIGILSALGISFLFALLPFYRYRKSVRIVRNALAQRAAKAEAAQSSE